MSSVLSRRHVGQVSHLALALLKRTGTVSSCLKAFQDTPATRFHLDKYSLPILESLSLDCNMSPSYRNLTLRLDSGALIGHSEKLLGQPGSGAVLLPVEQAFPRGLVTIQEARRLELLLQEMHARVPNAQPLRSISASHKRKEPDTAQVGLVLAVPCRFVMLVDVCLFRAIAMRL